MKRKKKNMLLTGLIYLVIFSLYNLTVFMVFQNPNNVFWISYGFMIASFLLHIVCVFYIFKNTDIRAVLFGIPLLSFSIYFVCAEFFCSMIFMVFKSIAGMKAAILIQALLLSVFTIVAVISIMSRDIVQDIDNQIKENVNFIKGIAADIEMLLQRSTDIEMTGTLKKLFETIRYSDPMTRGEAAVQEQMIMQHMAELRNVFDAGDMNRAKELCKELELLFIERNKKLMISK